MNTNQHTSAKDLNYFISVKLLILGTNVSQRPWLQRKLLSFEKIQSKKSIIKPGHYFFEIFIFELPLLRPASARSHTCNCQQAA